MNCYEFHRRIEAAWDRLGDLDEMCYRAEVGRQTMKGWLSGKLCPHPPTRRAAIESLDREPQYRKVAH